MQYPMCAQTNKINNFLTLRSNCLLDTAQFKAKAGFDAWEPLMTVADFNSLIAYSQEHQRPVYALTPEILNQKGAVWDQTKQSMEVFEKAFSDCADKLNLLVT